MCVCVCCCCCCCCGGGGGGSHALTGRLSMESVDLDQTLDVAFSDDNVTPETPDPLKAITPPDTPNQ